MNKGNNDKATFELKPFGKGQSLGDYKDYDEPILIISGTGGGKTKAVAIPICLKDIGIPVFIN